MSYMNPDEEWFREHELLVAAVQMKCPDGTTALKTGTWLRAVEYIERSVVGILDGREEKNA